MPEAVECAFERGSVQARHTVLAVALAGLVVADLALVVSILGGVYAGLSARAADRSARAAEQSAAAAVAEERRGRTPRLVVTMVDPSGERDNTAMCTVRSDGPQELDSVVVHRPEPEDRVTSPWRAPT